MTIKILFVTPLHPINKFNGASQRIMKVVETFKNLGCEPLIVYTMQDNPQRAEDVENNKIEKRINAELCRSRVLPSNIKIQNDGVINALDDFYPYDIEESFLNIVNEFAPDIVLVNYVFLSKFFEHDLLITQKKVLDTHDKLSRAAVYESAGEQPSFFCTTEEDELEGLRRADYVICIQDKEADYFRNSGIKNVITLGHLIDKSYINYPSFKPPKKLGFMGSWHIFNAKSIEQFIKEYEANAFLKENTELVFAGTICNLDTVACGKYTLLGRVESEKEFYEKVDIVINPVFFGTGLKIKTVDALSYGVPIVGSKIAFDGIETISEFHLAEDSSEIVKLLVKIVESPNIKMKLANLSKSIFEKYRAKLSKRYSEFVDELAGKESLKQKYKIRHLCNFVEVNEENDLYIAQPVTIESFKRATEYINSPISGEYINAEVTHYISLVDGEQVKLDGLKNVVEYKINKTIKDLKGFSSAKPLPFLFEIFRVVQSFDDDDIVVYTNADIGLSPQFYAFVVNKFSEGIDALIINRRTVSRIYSSPLEYSKIISDLGNSHPGFDCFVFSGAIAKKLILEKVVIGVHLIGRVLLWNLVKFGEKPKYFPKSSLTFHIGDDNAGKDEINNPLVFHNATESLKVLEAIYDNYFHKRVVSIDRKSLKFFYKPNIYRRDLYVENPVFIHSMFRTGSSYIWKKFNELEGVVAFYEPLHENLRLLSKGEVENASKATAAYHDRLGDTHYWGEYSALLYEDKQGVKGYDPSFSYINYCAKELPNSLIEYLEGLIKAVADKRAVLQFNRTALRQSACKQAFKNALNIYLIRDPRAQFASYIDSYLKTDGQGFCRTQAAIALKNIDSKYFSPLLKYLNKEWFTNSTWESISEFFTAGNHLIDKLNPRQLYFLFFLEWLGGLCEALKAESFIINTSRMSFDLLYRREVELSLMKEYLYLDFDDCSIPDSVSDILNLDEYECIEGIVLNTANRFSTALDRFLHENFNHVFSSWGKALIIPKVVEYLSMPSNVSQTTEECKTRGTRAALKENERNFANSPPKHIALECCAQLNGKMNDRMLAWILIEAHDNYMSPTASITIDSVSYKVVVGKPWPLRVFSGLTDKSDFSGKQKFNASLDQRLNIKKFWIE